MPDIQIKYDAPPTLARFMDSNAFVRFAVGPVGSGKSTACVLEILRRAIEQRPGPDGIRRTKFAVIRNTYRELTDTTRQTFEQWIPSALGKWHEQSFTFHMKFGDVQSDILFRALDRPEDIKKLLSLELTGAYINEVREMPKQVFDALQGRVGRFPSKLQGGPSWFGVWADTNPWHDGHWGQKLFERPHPKFELYRQPGGRARNAENVENLPPDYYETLCIGKDNEWIRVYVDGLDASGALGAVFGDLLSQLGERGGIGEFDHPTDGVYTNFDLGVSDSTAIWFWRLSNKAIDLIDYYEAHGQPLSHFFDVLDTRGYKYLRHVLPHDARARTLQTGVSTVELFEKRYPGMTAIAPSLSIADGLTAARWLLEQPIRIHSRADEGIKLLRSYRYEWDENKQVFSKTPVHDFSSHCADAFRYVACTYQNALNSRPQAEEEKPKLFPKDWTLNDIMEADERERAGRDLGRVR